MPPKFNLPPQNEVETTSDNNSNKSNAQNHQENIELPPLLEPTSFIESINNEESNSSNKLNNLNKETSKPFNLPSPLESSFFITPRKEKSEPPQFNSNMKDHNSETNLPPKFNLPPQNEVEITSSNTLDQPQLLSNESNVIQPRPKIELLKSERKHNDNMLNPSIIPNIPIINAHNAQTRFTSSCKPVRMLPPINNW